MLVRVHDDDDFAEIDVFGKLNFLEGRCEKGFHGIC